MTKLTPPRINEKTDLNQMDSKFADIWKQLDALNRSRLGDPKGRLPEYSHVRQRQSKDTGSGPPDWAEAVSPFLRALIHEDYWRRTWIVQEFIVASKLTVFFGHSYLPWEDTSVIPWNDFLGWITYYNEMAPGDASVQFILNLSHMRRSRFGDTSKFTLASLVDAFKGSLCQHSHDKIYAFRGLAHDHIDDSLPVDYRKTLFEVYKDAIHFQNTASARDEVERAVEMVHFSALIHHLLTQECPLTWQQHLGSLDLGPGSGGEDLDLGEMPRKLKSQAHQSRLFRTSSLAGSFMAVFLEELDLMDDTDIFPLKPDQRIALRGRAIRIKHIGPPLSELRASYTTTKRWAASIANHVQQSEQLEQARGLNNKLLMTLAGHPGDMRPFVGAGGAIGLVPPNARKGDLVCQFWNHDTCVVLRETVEWRHENGKHDVGYEAVGKSVLVSSVEGVDWEVAEDKTWFTQPAMGDGSWALDLRVDLADLMHLSLGAFGQRESAATPKPLC
ncbi:hypothetical protein NEMBOFW57_010865 [Staphylotrichum longicolle]|uniref:Heterokaryon incompatibility domain-containing protein n=1 Tax=Staphylotrichum longicolle TaxID=669026 RepID=A0AAD4HVN0_9PEZI|nr:hypothetical protein NEMBOFW57_010865 [Staphylotrichum longicolle]